MTVYVMQMHNDAGSLNDVIFIYRDFENLKVAFDDRRKMYEKMAERVKIVEEPHIDEDANEAVGKFFAYNHDGSITKVSVYDYDILDD